MPGEGLDQTTGMGKWGSVVRTEEGEDVDYVRWPLGCQDDSPLCALCVCSYLQCLGCCFMYESYTLSLHTCTHSGLMLICK